MMSALPDFESEETLLQYYGRLLRLTVDRTPKCHPEPAGEGIEYTWGCSKGFYRRLKISEKRTKKKFRESVRKCLDTSILTLTRQRLFSRRARQYIVAYHSLNYAKQASGDSTVVSSALIEKMVKGYKSHRSGSDFDIGFIQTILKEEGTNCR